MSGRKKQSRKIGEREEAVRETAEERLYRRSAPRSGPGKLLSAPKDVYLPLFVAQVGRDHRNWINGWARVGSTVSNREVGRFIASFRFVIRT